MHGILLCQAESADAVKEFVRACRFPHHKAGTDMLGGGRRGRGSEPTAAPIWGLDQEEYFARAEPWPLTQGELLLGVKIESPAGVANATRSWPCRASASPSSARAISACRWATPPCSAGPTRRKWNGPAHGCSRPAMNKLAFLEGATPEKIAASLDEGVRVISGHNPEMAKVGGRTRSARCRVLAAGLGPATAAADRRWSRRP